MRMAMWVCGYVAYVAYAGMWRMRMRACGYVRMRAYAYVCVRMRACGRSRLLLLTCQPLVSYFSPASRVGETAHQFATNFEMQLDFEDEAANLRSFTANFSSSFWSAMVT